MKPAPFAFVRPQGLQHALEALAADPGAKVLAGGQSLVPLLNMRLAAPSTLVDINGAARPRPRARRPRRASASVRWPGTPTCSPRPTYAGCSRCLARPGPRRPRHDPQPRHDRRLDRARRRGRRDADGAGPARRLGDRRRRPRGTRTIAAADLFAGPLESTLATTRSRSRRSSRPWRRATGVGFDEIARRHGDYALCGVGAVVRVEGDAVVVGPRRLPVGLRRPDRGRPDRRRSARSGRRPRPRRGGRGRPGPAHLDPADDIHATAAYRSPAGAGADRARPASGVRRRAAAASSGVGTVTEDLHDLRLVVNGVAHDAAAARPAAALRRPASRPRPDRHPRRLRARRVRRLHGARRRPAGALVPDVRGVGGRLPRSPRSRA